MVDGVMHRRTLLDAMAEAFARGDAAHGESLLTRALDEGVPWDEVTSTAARAVSVRYTARPRPASRA